MLQENNGKMFNLYTLQRYVSKLLSTKEHRDLDSPVEFTTY
jgi:hypothetical protein